MPVKGGPCWRHDRIRGVRLRRMVAAMVEGMHAQTVDALMAPGVDVDTAATSVPPRPGLYTFQADDAVWLELGLGPRPDQRPLYVGKSESSLTTRDVRTHFATGRTGHSTLRRTLAALLVDELELVPCPRNSAKPGYFRASASSPTGTSG